MGEKGYLKNVNWNRFYGDTQVNRWAKTVGVSNELTLTYLLPTLVYQIEVQVQINVYLGGRIS